MNKKTPLIVAVMLCVMSTLSFADKDGVPFPEGYRNWLHAKSMLIQPGHALENPFQASITYTPMAKLRAA